MADTQALRGKLKHGGQILLGVSEAIDERKAVVCLHAFHDNAAPSKPDRHVYKEVGGRACRVLLIRFQKTLTAVLINGGVLEKMQFPVFSPPTPRALFSPIIFDNFTTTFPPPPAPGRESQSVCRIGTFSYHLYISGVI